MKLIRFGANGQEKPGVVDSDGVVRDASAIVPDYAPETINAALASLRGADIGNLPKAPDGARIGAPLSRTGHFIAIGLNYADHAAETGAPIPAEPIVFSKAPSCLCGPNDDVLMPRGSVKLDWEVELAIVIGKRCDYVEEKDALDHVLGYALCNDVSEREYQAERGGQWMKGKSAPTFGPLGPWIATADEIADPQNLDMFLDVNGKRCQTGSTKTMIFGVAHVVSYLSQFMVLEPGDVITTGTPPGVGLGMKPPVFLKAGDTMRLGIAGLGEQHQKVVARFALHAEPGPETMSAQDTPKGLSDLDESALFYHRYPVAGKLEIQATKPLGNQRDLALAYSPGVAAPCLAIQEDPSVAADYTARANLVGVISNGTAVLGLGNIGALASKPVMEGKAVLFKKFAGIDVFDIEMNTPGIDAMVETVAALEPTFGGINLEDIKAPECFEIEERLKARMTIPVFHDDQHGTAIIVAAAVLNGLELAGKSIDKAKIVTSGAGAAAIACLNLLVSLGARHENIWVTDRHGVAHVGRVEEMDRWKDPYVKETPARTLADVIEGADVFLGLSAAGVLKPDLLKAMAPKPLILALANPVPEIMPEVARAARPDAMICTGRSDFPNQVNNVLCFPYIFRGALDVGATAINEDMKMAAVRAIAALAREEPSDVAARAYSGETPVFGPDFLIPSPFDPRLILRIAPAVAKAACESGVASRPIEDMAAYVDRLSRFVFRSGLIMKPVFSAARTAAAKRVIYADGEDERVLRAAQVVLEEGIAEPIIIGRPQVIDTRLKRYGLRIRPGTDFSLVNPEDDPRYRDYVDLLIKLGGRRGVTQEAARTMVRTNPTVIAALAMMRNEADAMICGLEGRFERHLRNVDLIIGRRQGVADLSALSMLISQRGVTFFTDTYVSVDPSAAEIAEMTVLAAEEIERFGLTPKAALLSHSNFGSRDSSSALKMREAARLLKQMAPDLEADGEMHGDSALTEVLRQRVFPHSVLKGEANLLVFPNLDSANIALTTIKSLMDALHVGPILLGTARPAHILTPSVTSRGIVNMTALAVVEASARTDP